MIRNSAPDKQQASIIDITKQMMVKAEEFLLTLPNNRERSLALTNLEQASMWATKAILEGSPKS